MARKTSKSTTRTRDAEMIPDMNTILESYVRKAMAQNASRQVAR